MWYMVGVGLSLGKEGVGRGWDLANRELRNSRASERELWHCISHRERASALVMEFFWDEKGGWKDGWMDE